MNLDANLKFSPTPQAVTADAASTDKIDLSGIRDAAVGPRTLYFYSICTVAMTDGASNSTLAVILESDSDSAFGSATAVRTLGTFPAVSAIGAKVGPIALGPGDMNERYAGIRYTPANGDLTTGSFSSFLSYDPHVWTAYPDSVTITVP